MGPALVERWAFESRDLDARRVGGLLSRTTPARASEPLAARPLCGVEIQPRLPLLSTYLGHVHPKDTYWYLQAAPELLQIAAERLERSQGGAS